MKYNIPNQIHKIVLCEGDIETLGFFSTQLAVFFQEAGYEVLIFNFLDEISSMIQLAQFIKKDCTAFITFNYTGLIGETCFDIPGGSTIWNDADIYCINIVVDHPFYYHKFYHLLPKRYYQYCIDRSHVAYMHRFFPELSVGFLPLGGTNLSLPLIPLKDRSMDLVFTGNYTTPESFHKDIARINDEYTAFYYGIIHDLIEHPDRTMEEVIEKHVRNEIPGASEQDLKEVMPNMIFIDLYVRFYFRGLVVQTLVDAGYPVHVFGTGWEKLKCKSKKNLIQHGLVDSKKCLEAISDAKISLNVMPWFKDGAHDRVYNSMANGAVCVSDPSIYLKETLKDHSEIVFYSLKEIEKLPKLIGKLLDNPTRAGKIAAHGYQTVMEHNTWKQRAGVLIEHLKSI